MIGAMPAVAVRHERRKQKNSKAHLLDGKSLRPNQLSLLKAHPESSTDESSANHPTHSGPQGPGELGFEASKFEIRFEISEFENLRSENFEFRIFRRLNCMYFNMVLFFFG